MDCKSVSLSCEFHVLSLLDILGHETLHNVYHQRVIVQLSIPGVAYLQDFVPVFECGLRI